MYTGPHRKGNRLKEYDYSQNGYYFVTICVKNRECVFGEIIDGKMILNEYGEIAFQFFQEIPEHFQNCNIDEFVIMPNHIHGIIILEKSCTVGNADLRSLQQGNTPDRTKMLLSKIIHGYKSSITRNIRKQFEDFTFSWQKSFYDVIIKNENQLIKTREYIENNPLKWELDRENPENIQIK